MRVQIGLKGASRNGGYRPAMNVGLVLDLRSGFGTATVGLIKALTDALHRTRQAGDRFSLTIAGPNGGLVVEPEAFRHGPLKVAIEQALLADKSARTGRSVGLVEAISAAAGSVRASERPDAVLGASMVILVTGNSLADDIGALENVAHINAVGGVPMSVVTLGHTGSQDDIERLAAAGQGSRRQLTRAGDAKDLIARELHTASRAVARALRLKIRLADGVRLVDVIGSRKLQPVQVQRTRQAERSIDRRLARDLGITADRGEDEEGIQIVIPNFYAGDEHIILLDVVAAGPGPVADVTLRYKDVRLLKNGTAHARLALPAGRRAAGRLERSVLKNLLTFELARRSREIGRLVDAGAWQQASFLLAGTRELLTGLRAEVPGWSTDPDLKGDETMLAEYRRALGSALARLPEQQRMLANSIRFAAFRKLHNPR